jgi:hypothetical protein
MAAEAAKDKGVDLSKRRCFVVSAFGANPEEQKRHKQVLRHLVRKVLGRRFQVVRADEIDDEGLITNQIIEHLIDDDLVIADLTGLNPNVFYEVAVRHAARKPIIHLITQGQEIPFDVANMRAVQYALDDPDLLEAAQEELARKVRAIEENDWKAAPNPVSVARDVWLLQESEQPEIREAGDILAAVGELRDELRLLNRRGNQAEHPTPATLLAQNLVTAIRENEPIGLEELRSLFPIFSQAELAAEIARLVKQKDVWLMGDSKYATIPF